MCLRLTDTTANDQFMIGQINFYKKSDFKFDKIWQGRYCPWMCLIVYMKTLGYRKHLFTISHYLVADHLLHKSNQLIQNIFCQINMKKEANESRKITQNGTIRLSRQSQKHEKEETWHIPKTKNNTQQWTMRVTLTSMELNE